MIIDTTATARDETSPRATFDAHAVGAAPPGAARTKAPTPAEYELPALDQVLAWSKEHGSRIGYFAALYVHTGLAVERGLRDGVFQNPEALATVNAVFYSRYQDALDAFRNGEPTASSWDAAFRAADDGRLTVLAHLVLGMNAHINYDLAIAVSEALPAHEIEDFHVDFERMNSIFASLVDTLAADLSEVWRPMRLLNKWFGRQERLLADTSMKLIRDDAWRNVQRLSRLAGSERERTIVELDTRASAVAHVAQRPGLLATFVLRRIRREERGSVAQVIDALLRG